MKKIKIYNIPKNDIEIGESCGDVYLWGKRIKKINISNEKSEQWFFYEIEKPSHKFKFKNKKWYENTFLLKQDCDNPRIIKINFITSLKLYWIYKKLWIQNKDNVMWLINIIVAFLAIITALLTIKNY